MKRFFLMMIFIIAGVAYMHAQQSYTTQKKTTVTTEKYNKNKIVALQWGNLRIEAYSKFLQVYRYQNGQWVQDTYIPRDKPGTYRFEKTLIADEFIPGRYMTHTIVVTVLKYAQSVDVSVTLNKKVKEVFRL